MPILPRNVTIDQQMIGFARRPRPLPPAPAPTPRSSPFPSRPPSGSATTLGAVQIDDLKRLRRARDTMDRDYAEPLDVAALARVALMSVGHFQRSFRAAYGETPYSYLMTRRIERAKTLLRRGDLSVTEVCMAVGCTSLGSFSTRFTELVGESPSAYRARDHSAAEHITACVAMYLTRPVRGTDTGRPQ
ncbi:AraC-like DNA-binding protein [Kitasatospora sp. SolWspMP-SS2h]|nr:AraC-like DNA-binding protein [Kitasatospora sp. SolWspMP-SS2h]